jgi:hypothetical protein
MEGFDVNTAESVEETPTESPETEQAEGQETEVAESTEQAPEIDLRKEIESIKEMLQSERDKREDEQRRAEYYQQLAQQALSAQKQPERPKYDPEELADFKGVERVVKDEVQAVREQMQQVVRATQVEAARKEFPDWDVAFGIAKKIADKTPGLEGAIMATPNPALTAYYIGKADPEYIQKTAKDAAKQATKQTVDKINSNLKAPATLGSASGASVKNTVEYFENLSDADLETLIRKTKFS